MGWEQFWENISNIGNLSLVIIVVAALLYYFGKLIGDVKVEKYEKTNYYIEGLFFTLLYIALPFVAVLVLTQYINLYISFLPSLILQIIIFTCLSSSAFANEYLKRHGLLSKFKELSRETIEQLKAKHRTIAIAEEKFKISTEYPLAFYKISIKGFGNIFALLFFSFAILWSSYSCITPESILLPSTILLSILTFFNMTFLALNFGYATTHYPHAKIVLENGSEINGKVLKFGEFVYLLKDEEKKLFINKDKIVSVEEDLFEENTENDEHREV